MGSKKSKKDIDTYLASIPVDARNALEDLRKLIRAAAPEAEEGYFYGVPAFKLHGKPLVCFAAYKKHCGFYPLSPDVLQRFSSELDDYETAEATIRFQPERPLPAELVKKIVKARIEELSK